jgi:ferritin
MTTTTKKQTAGNNVILKLARRVWNKPIFKKVSEVMNAEGEAAAVAYLQQFVRDGVDVVAHMEKIIAYMDARKAAGKS